MTLVIVDGGKYKDAIAGRLKRPNGRGSWMVYRGCDDQYAQQVTAEHKVNKKTTGGQTQAVWVLKHSHGDNHYLDCEVYAFAAADIMGVRTLHLQESQQVAEKLRAGMVETEQAAPEENWIQQNDNWI
jgi:phage terminase large subunit GpA-like protein